MTPERYFLAMILFHTTTLGLAAGVAVRWWRPERAALPCRRWIPALLIDVGTASISTYVLALLVTTAVNLDYGRRVYLGEISGRLMGQALFGEAILLAAALAWAHRRRLRAVICGGCVAGLVLVYVEAYRVEPRMLKVRRHVVNADFRDAAAIRILHITDIQTPTIGAHEERALRAGLAAHPDLIVLTGDYVQDALGRPTEDDAARDLRALMARIGFDAPLGVYATEGDVGPPCRDVFAGTRVRCLVDASTIVALPDGGTLGITASRAAAAASAIPPGWRGSCARGRGPTIAS